MSLPRSPVTISDVARAAGVSVTTVSRVLNQRYGVAAKTSAKVQAVIDELGYESSLVARSLRSPRTDVLGIIVMDLEPFSTELLKGAARAVRDTPYDLIVYSSGGPEAHDPAWQRRLVARLNGSLTDGIILVTPTLEDLATSAPVVTIDPNVGLTGLPSVHANNHDGAVKATEHLLALGHRRIGFVAGREDLESGRLRRQGYLDALAAAGLPHDPDLIAAGDYTRPVAVAAAGRLLDLPDRPTAIFAANDESAIGVLYAARERNLAVPADLSVVGFDNLPEAALTDPPLTTVDQSVEQMGHTATRLLIDQLDDPSREPVEVTLPTELVVRASSGPIPSRPSHPSGVAGVEE